MKRRNWYDDLFTLSISKKSTDCLLFSNDEYVRFYKQTNNKRKKKMEKKKKKKEL